MWRRLVASHHLQTLTRSAARRSDGPAFHRIRALAASSLHSAAAFRGSAALFSDADGASSVGKKKLEDVMPIATGFEREEIEAELEGKKRFDMDAPVGPFGTKEAPAVIKSIYDRRIVGCPGGEGEDEHDVVWFLLEKDRPHECPVCSQYFVLEVVGEGGPRPEEGHGDDDDEHH
ncbi:hypothetical protein QJS10_CPB22g01082 [Acorus calamus]|uniref:Cytochrome c oxidase subunit Vb n=1 Tax=Acorus calamus TaxID=4465 RepID=A0AAV9C365_ACOCL|nr:hypothetical protein QJS10_CPB22g01082 [Acorus calamus]